MMNKTLNLFPEKEKTAKPVSIRQWHQNDCGAACLCAVAGGYGKFIPIPVMRRLAGTGAGGASMEGLRFAAVQSGFHVRVVRVDQALVETLKFPAIAHCLRDGHGHFVVVHRFHRKKVRLMDPAEGRMVRISREEFYRQWTGILLLMEPAATFEKNKRIRAGLSRLLSYCRMFARQLLGIVVAGILYALLGLFGAVCLQKLLDEIIPGRNGTALWSISLILLACMGMQVLVECGKALSGHRLSIHLEKWLMKNYYSRFFRLPVKYAEGFHPGEMLSRLKEVSAVSKLISSAIPDLVAGLTLSLAGIFLALYYHPTLAVWLLAPLPFLLIVVVRLNNWNRQFMKELAISAAGMEALASDGLTNHEVYRFHGSPAHAILKFSNAVDAHMATWKKAGIIMITWNGVMAIIMKLSAAGLVCRGAYLAMRGDVTIGEMMAVYSMAGLISAPMLALMRINAPYQDAKVASERMMELEALIQPQQDKEMSRPEKSCKYQNLFNYSLQLEELSFSYGGGINTLDNLNFRVRSGSFTTIAGWSGSGKSTLGKLLAGYEEPDSGKLLLNGSSISDYPPHERMAQINLAPQQTKIIKGSVLFNITLEENYDAQRLENAIQGSGLKAVIGKLPLQLQTVIGLSGIQLSGGEARKLALARLLYQNPDIFVMDEITAGLDPSGEKEMIECIRKLHSIGKTIINITHQPWKQPWCDQVILLRRGRIAGIGKHEYLLKENEEYRKLLQASYTVTIS